MLFVKRILPQNAVASDSIIFFLSESFSSLLTLITGFLIARLLPVADFGKFTAALAFASILGVLVDSGMGMSAAKDIAKGTSTALSQVDQFFSWRLEIIGLACLFGPLVGWLLLPSPSTRWLTLGLIPGVLLVGTTDFFCWIFKGAQKALWCAGLQLTSRILLLVCCVLAVLSTSPMRKLALAYGITGVSMTALGLYVLARSMHVLHMVHPTRTFFSHVLPDLYKLGAILILSVIFTRVDIMLVARLQGDVQAGLFSAASRVVDGLRLIPMVVYSVYLPIFSKAHNQPHILRSTFRSGFQFLLMLSIAIALLASLFSKPLFTHLLGSRYAEAAFCFRPLVWSCVMMFINILMFALLYALNDHRSPLIGIMGALGIEILLDIVGLPRFGILAAAWARLIAEFFNGGIMAWGLWHHPLFSSASAPS